LTLIINRPIKLDQTLEITGGSQGERGDATAEEDRDDGR
jgi:hypothetical protein